MALPNFKKAGKVVVVFVAIIVLLLIGAVSTVVAYKLRPSLFSRWIGATAQTAAAQKEADATIAEIAKVIDLPTDETPTIATVSDADKLKSQPFFSRAQNGDKVLFYTKAKKAYLYRPSAKKMIDIAPLSVGQTATATPSAQVQATPAPVKVSLLNGSTVAGLTATAERKVKTVAGVSVSSKDNAKSSAYTKTTVVNVNDVKSDVVAKIAQAVGGTVDTLPAGEVAPADADVLIILAP